MRWLAMDRYLILAVQERLPAATKRVDVRNIAFTKNVATERFSTYVAGHGHIGGLPDVVVSCYVATQMIA